MSVHYKFKSELVFDTVSFDGVHISVADLKKAILHQKRLSKCDFGLLIKNAQTEEEYNDDNALIAKNTSVIISRVPLTVQQKRSWDRNESQSFTNTRDESSTSHPVDLSRIDGSENDKINAMMTQSTHDYNPLNYQKLRGGNQTGEVPPSYRCHKCQKQGHWIKNCPLTLNHETSIDVKKSTGIPRSFMVPVEGPQAPGAMMTPTGHYAVPAIDHQAYKEGKKERPPFSSDPEPITEKPEIPDDLLCNYCKDLLTDAVLIPCCGGAFCDECIRSFLIESDKHECPTCNEKDISPSSLIPTRYLRNNVMKFTNETGYAKRQIYRPALSKVKDDPEVEKIVETTVAVLETIVDAGVKENAIAEMEHVPSAILTNPPSSAVEDEAKIESIVPMEPGVKGLIEEGHEVIIPPPPGTEEPLLPIASINPSPEKEPDHGDINLSRKEDYEEDYEDDRRVRDQRRIYNKDPQRDRSGECGRIVDTYRVINKRGSSSPRRQQQLQQQQQQQQQQGDYPVQHGHQHMINQSKGYQNMPPGNSQRYPPNMHYESDIRRSGGDRPGTPTIDEPHLHSQGQSNQGQLLPYPPGEERIAPPPPPPQQQGYNQQQALTQHGAPLLPDPYMSHGHRMPMYPHQQGPHYGPPRYDRPPYQQPGYRPSQPRGSYNGPPRPMRGMHHLGYRGVQPPPMGLARNVHNGNPPGVIDDPLEAFNRMLREKDERDRRLGKHRRRSRTRSRSRSYTRSRSRSFGRRSPPSRISRSRSPPPKRRTSRSPLPSRRSRSPKRRSRDGSRSFSISRSRSYSRSQSPPRVSMSRDRDRDRDRDRERERDLPPRYRSPVRSPPRFQRDRERERDRPRSREPRENYTSSYYSESKDYNYRERDVSTRERTSSRYPSRNQSSQHNIPSLMSLGSQQPASSTSSTVQSSTTTTVAATTTTSTTAAAAVPERKDYYDSYNSRYSGPSSGQQQRFNSSPTRDYHKRFDDVAPPGTEGYYDLPPPGVDHPERSSRDDRDRSRVTKDQEEREHKDADDDRPSRDDRPRERDIREKEDRDRRERDREREKDDRQIHQKEKDERERRDAKDKEHDRYIRRDDDRTIEKRDYEKEKDRYRDERERERDRHRSDDKIRGRERTDRKERGDYDEKERENSRHESRHSVDRKKNKKSSSPHVPKTRSSDTSRDLSPEKKKEKKIKEKKKKKDSIEDKLEKKKKKKKEKKSLKEAIAKNEILKSQLDNRDNINEKIDDKILSTDDKKHDDDEDDDKKNTGDVSTSHDESIDISDQNNSLNESTKKDDTKDYKILNPKLLENSNENCQNFDNDFCLNPPNSNFKPIPEIKNDIKKPIDSLYDGLDDAEINTVITEKYTILPDKKLNIDDSSEVIAKSENLGDDENSKIFEENTPTRASSTADSIEVSTTVAAAAAAAVGTTAAIEKSPKDEFLAPMPELSKWERDEREDEPDDNETDTAEEFIKLDVSTSPQPADTTTDELQSTKIVTSEVLKRAENAIFQKAINAIRPIEIKKISESRKILYQNPEPKSTIDTSQDTSRSNERKTVNVTINVGKNERNVELAEPSMKKSKLDRSKFRGSNDSSSYSPTRLSAKERLGDKVDDDKTDKSSTFYEKDLNKNDNNKSSGKIKSPKTSRKNSPVVDVVRHSSTSDRKVFLEDKKQRDNKNERSRDHHRSHHSGDRYETKDNFVKRERNDNRDDSRSGRNSDNRIDRSDKERRGRTPTYSKQNPIKRKIVDEEVDKKKDKKRDDKKRKRAHRSSSRSKSKDSKRKKEKKHKDKKQKHSKDHSSTRDKILVVDDKTIVDEKIKKKEDTAAAADDDVAGKKAGKKNPRLITDRKRSALDEASFEPDYSASESDDNDDKNNDDDNNSSVAAKKAKLDESIETEKESEKVEEKIIKKRVRSASSDEDDDEDDEDDDDDDSSSSVSSSSESDDSSYRKRKKKHKKHKKRKSTKKESSSDSDTYSDSTDSSSDDDKHKKKSKKSKSKSKQSKKKKKSKHK